MQLRFVDVGDGFVAFTFGFSSAARTFEIPAFDVTPAGGSGGSGTLRPSWAVNFAGGSATNPDGTPSYTGPSEIGVERGAVRAVVLEEGTATTMRWVLPLRREACPRALTKRYGTGSTFPRAQVFVLFDARNAITLESPRARVHEPVLVSGVGFAAGAIVVVRVDGRAVSSAPAKPDGSFESVFFVPRLDVGRHTITATDSVGPTPTAVLEVSGPP